MRGKDDHARVGFVSIASTTQRQIGAFTWLRDTSAPLDISGGRDRAEDRGAELGSHRGRHPQGAGVGPRKYAHGVLRRFVLAVKPDINTEFTHLGSSRPATGNRRLAIEIFRALEGSVPGSPRDLRTSPSPTRSGPTRRRSWTNEAAGTPGPRLRGLEGGPRPRIPRLPPSVQHCVFRPPPAVFEKAPEHLSVSCGAGNGDERVREASRIIKEIEKQA